MTNLLLRRFWSFCSVLCSLAAFVCVFTATPETAFTVALSGLAFFLLANTTYDDIDNNLGT